MYYFLGALCAYTQNITLLIIICTYLVVTGLGEILHEIHKDLLELKINLKGELQ